MDSLKERLDALKRRREQGANADGTAETRAPDGCDAPPTVYAHVAPTPGLEASYHDDTGVHKTSFQFVEEFFRSHPRRRVEEQSSMSPSLPLTPSTDVHLYSYEQRLSEGVYGIVSRGKREDGVSVALKRIKSSWITESPVGFPSYLLREFDIVRRSHHPNVLRGLDVCVEEAEGDVFLVTEFGGRDLKSFLYASSHVAHITTRNTSPDAPRALQAKLKCCMRQLLEGLAFLHDHRVVHRDLKTSNVLVSDGGVVCICDFGLARQYAARKPLTDNVVTLMYRAPELHFGVRDYSAKVDMWSVGCIFAEMFLKQPLFAADVEAAHFLRLCDVLGLPDERTTFEGCLALPEALRMIRTMTRTPKDLGGLRGVFCASRCRDAAMATEGALDLLTQLLRWNPKHRPSAREALRHFYFTSEDPPPCHVGDVTAPLPIVVDVNAAASADDAVRPEKSPEQADDMKRRRMHGGDFVDDGDA